MDFEHSLQPLSDVLGHRAPAEAVVVRTSRGVGLVEHPGPVVEVVGFWINSVVASVCHCLGLDLLLEVALSRALEHTAVSVSGLEAQEAGNVVSRAVEYTTDPGPEKVQTMLSREAEPVFSGSLSAALPVWRSWPALLPAALASVYAASGVSEERGR